jgi:hypothetical protein
MYTIWHDNDYDFALWVYKNSSLSDRKEETFLRQIPNENAPHTLLKSLKSHSDFQILPLIKYERPDIIIQHTNDKTGESKIIFATEFMTHTPQWQHPAQRFSRIYSASQLKVPVALVLPRNKVKLEKRRFGEYKETIYVCSPVIYSLFIKTSLINRCPTLLFHWPDVNGYLISDTKHPTAPAKEQDILEWFTFLELALNSQCSLSNKFVENRIAKLKTKTTNVSLSSYDTIKAILKTKDAISNYKLDASKLSKNFLTRDKTLIFEPTGLSPPTSYFRTDPYAGMLCAFDNLFCRNVEGNKVVNILLRAKDVELSKLIASGTFINTSSHNVNDCPFKDLFTCQRLNVKEIVSHLNNGSCPYTSSKQQRIYGEVADVIVFDDAIYYGGDKGGQRV